MTILMKEATTEDMELLLNFRWDRAYENKNYDRKDMRAYKKDFRYFLKSELNKDHRCLFFYDENQVLATIYWAVHKDNVRFSEEKRFTIGYIRYFEAISKKSEDLLEPLLQKVIEICKEEDVRYLGSFYNEKNEALFFKYGFNLEDDLFSLELS